MKKYFSKDQFFKTYLLLSPLGRKYWSTDDLMLEFERKGYGFRDRNGFTFANYAPKHKHISDLPEIPTLSDYKQTHRLGTRYVLQSTLYTITTVLLCLYLSYFMAQKTYELKQTRQNERR